MGASREGDTPIYEVQPRAVELWLRELPLSPKSKTHVRSLMHAVVEFAMWAGMLQMGRNPISLVQNKGATRKVNGSPCTVDARSMNEHIADFVAPLRSAAWTYGIIAIFGMVLASVGLAGMTAYSVVQRRSASDSRTSCCDHLSATTGICSDEWGRHPNDTGCAGTNVLSGSKHYVMLPRRSY